MKRLRSASICLALLVSMLFAAGAIGTEIPSRFEDGRLLVGFKPGIDWSQKRQMGVRLGAVALRDLDGLGATLFQVPLGTVLQKAVSFSREPSVTFAEPDFRVRTLATPTDSNWTLQWGPAQIQTAEGWDVYPSSFSGQGASGTGVKVAVVDTGILASHADLNDGRVLTSLGANCVSGSCTASTATDDNGHGTHVAGIISAETNNLQGIAGVAFNSVLIPVKVVDAAGEGTDLGVASGIVWAAQKGAKIINVSLGSTAHSSTLCNAVTTAASYGSLVVAASGNDGAEGVDYPAACFGAVAVGATSTSDSLAEFSDSGSQLWSAAPGVDILSTYQSGYAYASGTSMSSPHAAAVAAMISSQAGGTISLNDVKKRLASTADKVGSFSYGTDPNGLGCSPACTWNKQYGYGRINLHRAMVAGAAPNFSLAVSPASQSLGQGSSTSFGINVARSGGFSSSLTLSVAGLPTGATGSFSPNPLTGNTSTSTLSINTASTTPRGTYTLTINGTGGGITRTASATLIVRSVRTVRHAYVGGPGDVFTASCLGVNLGGACMPVAAGETVVSFKIDDDLGWPVGGFYQFLGSGSQVLSSGGFCDSSTQAIPPGAVTLRVLVDEAFSTLDCNGQVGAGTKGWVEATFSE